LGLTQDERGPFTWRRGCGDAAGSHRGGPGGKDSRRAGRTCGQQGRVGQRQGRANRLGGGWCRRLRRGRFGLGKDGRCRKRNRRSRHGRNRRFRHTGRLGGDQRQRGRFGKIRADGGCWRRSEGRGWYRGRRRELRRGRVAGRGRVFGRGGGSRRHGGDRRGRIWRGRCRWPDEREAGGGSGRRFWGNGDGRRRPRGNGRSKRGRLRRGGGSRFGGNLGRRRWRSVDRLLGRARCE
jgi:hypothetical protein